MNSSLSARLEKARERWFVGREREIECFQKALKASGWDYALWHIHGMRGVGKSALLRRFALLARKGNVAVFVLDIEALEPTPAAFCRACSEILNLPDDAKLLDLAAFLVQKSERVVLQIDNFHHLVPLENWLRTSFLPLLPANVAVVSAGREPLSFEWRSDAGWQQLVCSLDLDVFSETQSRDYLCKRGLDVQKNAALLAWAHGHPLALSMGADAAQLGLSGEELDLANFPSLGDALLNYLAPDVPSPRHRAALELGAVVSSTTQELLSAILGQNDDGADWRAIFEWLRALPEMQSHRFGTFPREILREVLTADLRFRTPDLHADLHRRARDFYISRLYRVPPHEQARVVYDGVFLHRLSPMVAPYLSWSENRLVLEDVRPGEIEVLLTMVEENEGAQSRQIAARWFASQSENLSVVRDPGGAIQGFLFALALQKAESQDLESDAGAQRVWNWLQSRAPLRAGENALFFRFWMARESYQAVSDAQSLLFVAAVRRYLVTPNLAYTFFPCQNADFWRDGLVYADLERVPDADFEIEGRKFGVFGHDWRARPVLAWLDLLSQREMQAVVNAPPSLSQGGATYRVLEKSAFLREVKLALRDWSHNSVLQTNPLLETALVFRRAHQLAASIGHVSKPGFGVDERMNALRALLREALDDLKIAPRLDKEFAALDLVYGRRHLSQEAAANTLNVSNSSLRRYLRAGIEFVGENLWAREIGAENL